MATSSAPLSVPDVTLVAARGNAPPDPGVTAPTAPPVFTTSPGSNSISAIVSEPNGATRYNVRVDAGATQVGSVASGLAPSTSYSFQVQGENDGGVSAWSTAVAVSTTAVGAYTGLTDPARQFTVVVDAVGGTLGANVSDPSGILNGKQVFNANAWGSTYSDDMQIDGQNVIKCFSLQAADGLGLGGNLSLVNHASIGYNLQKGDELWVRAKAYFPSTTWEWNTGRNKFFRLRYSNNGGGSHTDLYIDGNQSLDQRQFWWISEQENSWTAPHTDPYKQVFDDTAHTFEMHTVFDDVPGSSGGKALQRVWLDGRLIIDGTKRTMGLPGGVYTEAGLFKYYSNVNPTKDIWFYLKDFIVQSSVPAQRDAAGNPFIGV